MLSVKPANINFMARWNVAGAVAKPFKGIRLNSFRMQFFRDLPGRQRYTIDRASDSSSESSSESIPYKFLYLLHLLCKLAFR